MQEFDYVYVVVVYRNTRDLAEFLKDLEGRTPGSCRVVVVNNYFDEATRDEFEKICSENGCDFINSENKGYGAGNNLGIEYARKHYRFRYLIVSNPDILIGEFPDVLQGGGQLPQIVGPYVCTLGGKRQNPCMVIFSPFREFLMKAFAVRPQNRMPFFMAIAINKAERILYNLFLGRRGGRVYSLHGSFLIFSAKALELLGPPFDSRMFLFREEDVLARSAKALGIRMIFEPRIRVLHKEDGSVAFISGRVREHTIRSLRIYFGLLPDDAETFPQ